MVKKVIVAQNLKAAKEIATKYKGKFNLVAVEAEWGDEALEEPLVDLSLNHHGCRANNPCPAEIGIKKPEVLEDKYKGNTVYIVSHLDADTIMGIMWIENILETSKEISKLAEMVAYSDKNGFHNAQNYYQNLKDTDLYKKWLAMGYVFSRNSKTSPGELTNKINGIIYAINNIIKNTNIADTVVYNEANEWNKNISKSAKKALVYTSDNILGFSGKLFYCNNYNLLENKRDIIVQYDTEHKNIILAVFDKNVAVDYFGEKGVVSLLQEFFGDKAGGHTTIGGSPRNKKYKQEDFLKFIKFVESKISLNKNKH